MKQQIDNLVALVLLEEGALYLPERGSIMVERVPAKRLSDKSMQMPYNKLRYVGEEQGAPITKHIARVANVDAERAADIYNEWLSQSVVDGQLSIGGVAVVEEGKEPRVEDSFELRLNPKGRGVIGLKPRSKANGVVFTIVGIVILFVLGAGGYLLYTNGVFDAKEEPAPVVEEVVVPVVEPVVEEVVPVKDPDVLDMKSGYSYVSWGVYTQKENALKYKAMLRRVHPTLDTNIYDYDGRYMVAIFESKSRNLCNRKVESWKEMDLRFDGVWVYTR